MLKKQTKDISTQRKVPHSGELDEDKEEATAGLAGMFKMLLGIRAVNSVHSSLSRPTLQQAGLWY